MSRIQQVFKPLFIDTFEYNYLDGKTEKSFTIKKKSEPKTTKGKMQKSEPLASFNNEAINNQQNNLRSQTSRRMRSSSFSRNKTIIQNIPIINDQIRKVESRMEEDLIIQPTRNNFINKSQKQQISNYVDFNIAQMNGDGSTSFHKALKLINNDNKLMMRKQNKSVKPKSTQINDLVQLQYLESIHPQTVLEDIGKMLTITEKNQPIRKQSRVREAFTRNLQFLDQSFKEASSPEKKLKCVIQNYFEKKKQYLEDEAKKEEIQITQLSQQTKPNIHNNRMRISATFLKQFVNSFEENQNIQQQQQNQKQTEQSIKSSQIISKKIVRKQSALFNKKVQAIFQKMFHLIIQCVRKMKQMKLSTQELFKTGVIMRKPYEREGSFVFFEGIEENNFKLINFMLQKCRYYAFDINEEGFTGLHLCAQKGYKQIAEKLLNSGTYPDQVDFKGKTPLYYAIENQQINLVTLLLYFKADPWSNKSINYFTTNLSIMRLIKMSRKLHILLLMTNTGERDQAWQDAREVLLN